MKSLALLFLCCGYFVAMQAQIVPNEDSPTIREKIFIHTDKSFYVAGEIIWFKLYVRDQWLQAAHISQLAYVELIGGNRQPVLQAKIALEAGTGSGSFHLPLSIHSGNYYLRAYTTWMRNDGPEAFFEKQLTIVNTLKAGVPGNGEGRETYDIQFFPQGGQLVQGLENIIAFKATGRDGKGVSCSGFILSAQGDTVQQFRTLRYGMGRFAFKPETTAPYTAWIQMPDTLLRVPLPDVAATGYTLDMAVHRDSLTIIVETNTAPGRPFYLAVHSGGKDLPRTTGKWEAGKMKIRMEQPVAAGISRLTVLNSRLEPICERLYFKKPDSTLHISIHTDKEVYGLRDAVPIDIGTAVNDSSTAANLSMSVYLVDELQSAEQENIAHYFWLSSELNGKVEDPGFYFSDDSAVADATENLLLTQGWRRIEGVPSKKNILYLPEWEGPVISGRILSKNGTGFPGNKQAYLSFAGERFQLATAVSDSLGSLRFITRKFYGRGNLVVQPADSNFYITLSDPFSELYAHTGIPSLQLPEHLAGSLNRRSIASQLQNQFTATGVGQFAVAATDTTPFYGIPDKQYLLDAYTRFTTMEEVLREFVPEVRLRKGGDGFRFQVRNNPDMQFFEQPPLVLLDGVPVANTSGLVAYSPLNIKKIDVIARRWVYGAQSYPGIVSFTTYSGDLPDFTLPSAANIMAYEGVQWQRVFYTPAYEAASQKESRVPDFRNQLRWIPNLQTAGAGAARILCYASDMTGKFAIVVQGISETGLPGAAVRFIDVLRTIDPAKQ